MLPTLARLRTDEERYRSAYLQAVNQLLLVTQPGIVFAIATADIFVPILLGEKWRAAAPIFQWLGLAALLQPIGGATNWLFISQGRSQAFAWFGASMPRSALSRSALACPGDRLELRPPIQLHKFCCGARSCCGWRRVEPVRPRDLYGLATVHALASAASFTSIVVTRLEITIEGVPALALMLCLSYATTLLVLAMIPSGRTTLRDSISIVTLIASRS